MASQFNLITDITATEKIRKKLVSWANDELPENEQERLIRLCEDADYNFIGFLPFVIDNTLEGNPEEFASRAFCDGAEEVDDANIVRVYFHAPHDACRDLWEFITEKYTDIEAVRVYVDPDYEDDIEELGEDDLFHYVR